MGRAIGVDQGDAMPLLLEVMRGPCAEDARTDYRDSFAVSILCDCRAPRPPARAFTRYNSFPMRCKGTSTPSIDAEHAGSIGT